MKGAIARSRDLKPHNKHSFMPDQFANPANPDVHYRTTAEEIWADTDGHVDALVCGVGTGGTLTGTTLEILVEGDPILFNPYGVIVVNPDKGANIQDDLANQFVNWLVSLPAQEMIAEFGIDEFGMPLFVPDSALYRASMGTENAERTETGAEDDAAEESAAAEPPAAACVNRLRHDDLSAVGSVAL